MFLDFSCIQFLTKEGFAAQNISYGLRIVYDEKPKLCKC